MLIGKEWGSGGGGEEARRAEKRATDVKRAIKGLSGSRNSNTILRERTSLTLRLLANKDESLAIECFHNDVID